jgi:hypothetical protein
MSANEPARRGILRKLWEWCRRRPALAALFALIVLQQLAYTALFSWLISRYKVDVQNLRKEIEELRSRPAK